MIGPLAFFTVLYASWLCLWALVRAVLRRPSGTALIGGLVLLELILWVQAGADVLSLLAGHSPADPATHVGYLVASVLLLPVLVTVTRTADGAEPDLARSRQAWTSVVLTVACLAVAVVMTRMWSTWHPTS